MGPHFMLLLLIYVLYSNVTYIYPVSCLVEIKLFQIVSKQGISQDRSRNPSRGWGQKLLYPNFLGEKRAQNAMYQELGVFLENGI